MKTKLIRSCALCLTIFMGVFVCAEEEVGEMIDNPMYLQWSVFKPGSFVTHEHVTSISGIETKTKITNTVKNVTPEKVELEMTTLMNVAGKEYEQSMPVTHPAKVAKGPEAENKFVETDKGEETLDVDGQEVKAEWVEKEYKEEGKTTTMKVWSSEEVPGEMVKTETKIAAETNTEISVKLIEYKAVK